MLSGLLGNALFTIHNGKVGGRGLSPRLWSRVSGQALSPDGFSNGFFASDDFSNFSGFAPATSGTTALPSTTVPGPSGYGLYLDTATAAASITSLATEDFGVARFSTPAQDNHEAWLSAQGNTGTFGSLSSSAPKLTIFETRVRVNSVADDATAFFVGLSKTASAVADSKVDDTGVMANRDFIGFNTVHTNSGTTGTNALMRMTYKKTGATQQTPGSAITITAATWYKLGLIYDPLSVSERLKFFVNNVQQAALSATDVSASTFPDAVRMTFLAGIKNGSATAATFDCDWWAYFQAGQ